MHSILLTALAAAMLFPVNGIAGPLPMISMDQLRPGHSWTWTYYTGGDPSKPYSWERYDVIETHHSVITFEISSRYEIKGDFIPHTRFKADVSKCHRAFQNPNLKVNFMIDLYPFSHGKWEVTPISTRATAFEEKFNCNPIEHTSRRSMYETRFEGTGTDAGFQQWPKATTSQLRSYYYINYPGLEGVAYRKDFNPGTPHFYEMRLTSWRQ